MLYGVLFGYEVKNGTVCLHRKNAKAVRMVYEKCSDGESLTAIAKKLRDDNIAKIRGSTNWNTTEIKNLIRDERYRGDSEYPEMVSQEIFEQAQAKLNERVLSEKSKEFYKIRRESEAFYEKIYCTVCDKKFNKEYRYHTWKCSGDWKKGAMKHSKKRYSEKVIKQIVVGGINALIEIQEGQRKKVGGTYFLETNEVKEVTKKLEEALTENNLSSDELKNKIYKKAQLMIQNCVIRESGMEQNLIRNYLMGWQRVDEFDVELFRAIVDQILISPNGDVAMRFIDGTIIDVMM